MPSVQKKIEAYSSTDTLYDLKPAHPAHQYCTERFSASILVTGVMALPPHLVQQARFANASLAKSNSQ